MKILAISNIFPPGFMGGYELGAYDILRFLAQNGHDIHVVTSDYLVDDAEAIRGMRVERILDCPFFNHATQMTERDIRRSFWVNPGNLRKLASGLAGLQPDLVLCFNLAGLGPRGIIEFLNASGLPVVYYFMDNFLSNAPDDERRSAYDRIIGVPRPRGGAIFMSENLRADVETYLDFSQCRSMIVPGWADLISSQVPTRTGSKQFRFLFCGQIASHKGVDLILAAALELKSLGYSDFIVDMYGQGHVTEFFHQVSERQIGDVIRYRGMLAKEDMRARIAEYDALLFPTWSREPFGFVVSEAAAAGCIPVMTAGIGASECFLDGIDCLKIERSAAGLREAMIYLLTSAPDVVDRMKAAAWRNAKLNLGPEHWLLAIQRFCLLITEQEISENRPRIRQIESALNALNEIWIG